MDVFAHIHPDAPLVVAEAVWQYSGHLWAGLLSHRGPILTVANWSGQWPGLVGMLNLNACLRKAGVPFSTRSSSTTPRTCMRLSLQPPTKLSGVLAALWQESCAPTWQFWASSTKAAWG
jgi:hypothetical protein